MLARGALCRLAAEAPKTTPHELPQLARLLQRTLLARNAASNPAARALSRAYVSALQARRSYATTTRATTPTETVKKAVKAQAVKKPAPKKPAAIATKPKPKPKTKAAAKKPAAKKKPVAKKPARKADAPKKRTKKVVTPEAKEKALIAALRKKALKEPLGTRALNSYNIYIADVVAARGDISGKEAVTAAANKWKTLSPAEREHYNHLATERTAARRVEYRTWVYSHTPEEIKDANKARAKLRVKLPLSKSGRRKSHTLRIPDDRAVKQPRTPFVRFVMDRHTTGDFKGITLSDASKLLAAEWKALSVSEKKKYVDPYEAEKASASSERASSESTTS